MLRNSIQHAILVLGLAVVCAFGQAVPAFNASGLVKLGDSVKYGSYSIIKLGDGIYQLEDSGDPKAKAGGLIGVDMYLIRGTAKALPDRPRQQLHRRLPRRRNPSAQKRR